MNKIFQKIKSARVGGVLLLSFVQFLQRFPYKFLDKDYFLKLRDMQIQQSCGKIIYNLSRKYRAEIKALKQKIADEDSKLPHNHSKIIWIMWLQGMDNAPDIVKMCYRSIVDGFSGEYEIVVLDESNIKEYVSLPDYIEEKYNKGYISKQWYADLIRLELLDKYGGTWMDATIFYSGGKIPYYMLQSDLFIFQSLFPATLGIAAVMNSFFITACQNNKIIKMTKLLFYEYWRKYNVSCDYWLVSDFFEIACHEFMEDWEKVIPHDHTSVHILQDKMFKSFNQEIYNAAIAATPFHKLNWKLSQIDCDKENTLYKYLIKS